MGARPLKPLTHSELQLVVENLREILGAQLQEIVVQAGGLGLGFYWQRKIRWVWIDLDPVCPLILLLDEIPQASSLVKPILLFLRAHARGQRLADVSMPSGLGRVVSLKLGPASNAEAVCEIEARLFPHGQNISVRTKTSEVYWSKPKDLPQACGEINPDTKPRDLVTLVEQWRSSHPQFRKSQKDEGERRLRRLKSTRSKMEKNLAQLQSAEWSLIGEHLKTYGFEKLPQKWESLVVKNQSVSWNMQRCFAKAGELPNKILGQQQRLRQLQEEMEQISNGEEISAQRPKSEASKTKRKGIEIAMRRYREGDFEICIGKSATDNLALLRQAKAWDYWLHLRDYPGAHGIVHREKKQTVPREILEALSRHLIRHSRSQKFLAITGVRGEKFDIVVTECRFVQPIKGAGPGRVVYRNEKILSVSESPLD